MNKSDLYYQVASYKLSEQGSRNQQLEYKASASIGISAPLIGLAGFTISSWNSWSIAAAVVMLLAFGVAAITAISILWIRDFYNSPKLSELSQHLTAGFDDAALTEWTADAYSASIDLNEDVLREKAESVKLSLAGLITEGIFLGLLILSTQL